MASFNFIQSTAANVWLVNHALDSNAVLVDVMILAGGGTYVKSYSHTIEMTNTNAVTVRFPTSVIGRVRVFT